MEKYQWFLELLECGGKVLVGNVLKYGVWRKSISGLVECVEKVWTGSKKCYTLKSIISPLGCAKAYEK